VPMIITLNEYAEVRMFEERNCARLLCGTLAEIR
jgi:hypothetical protein